MTRDHGRRWAIEARWRWHRDAELDGKCATIFEDLSAHLFRANGLAAAMA